MSAAPPMDRRLNARYRQLIELAPDAILVHDGEVVELANAAAARLAGAGSADELRGRRIAEFLAPPYLKSVESEIITSGERSAVAPPVRDTFRRLDGSEVPVEVSSAAIMDGARLSAHLMIRDITDRVAVERTAAELQVRLRHTQKMEAIGALAGGVAHEVNNMMTVILGFTEFMLQDPALPHERIADMRQVSVAAGRAANITRQLLAFSRRSFYRPQVMELDTAIRGLEPMIGRLLGEHQTLALDLTPAPAVWLDREQFTQIAVNFTLNARDAMEPGGTLTIAVRQTDLPEPAPGYAGASIPAGRYTRVSFSDDGSGMSAETEAKLFEPFYTTKAVGQGTGLGLAAVYGILEQNGAYVALDTETGRGTTFALFLPVASEQAVADRAARTPRPVGAPVGASVLVVEDEDAVRAMVTRSLELAGFRVLQAANGRDAIQVIADRGAPDLVLTDMMMPQMDGIQLADHLAERWPAMPVLFTSGYAAEELERRGIPDVRRKMLQKPFTPDTLVRFVTAVLARRISGRSDFADTP